MSLLFSPMLSLADAVRVHGIYYDFYGDEATVTHGNSTYSGFIDIPSTVTYNGKTYTVTCIGTQAFRNNTYLHSVTIPTSVKTIDQEAFYGCSSLTSITIPDNLKTICRDAFSGCI